jgi:hypothetical protein
LTNELKERMKSVPVQEPADPARLNLQRGRYALGLPLEILTNGLKETQKIVV